MDPRTIYFTQNSISDHFQADKWVPQEWRGRPIQEAVEEAKTLGKLPDGLVVNAVRLGDGRWFTLNNRTLYVACLAMVQVHPKDAGNSGTQKMNELLRNSGLPDGVLFDQVTLRTK